MLRAATLKGYPARGSTWPITSRQLALTVGDTNGVFAGWARAVRAARSAEYAPAACAVTEHLMEGQTVTNLGIEQVVASEIVPLTAPNDECE